MKTVLLAALLLAAPVFAQEYPGDDDYSYSSDVPPPPDQGPTFDDFQSDSALSWNGEWVDTWDYGRVWRPTRVSDDWQPYMNGRWVWTDAGWAWASDEPFGWAVYHYGRWVWLADTGWAWIPGRVWAPAWVAWRWGDGYAAWCPLGPSGHVYQQPARWVYVPERRFLEPVRRHVIPVTQRAPIPVRGPGPRAAPPVEIVQRVTGQTVRPLPVRDAPAPHAAQPHAGSIDFYRPRTAPVAVQPSAGPRAAPSRQIDSGPRYGGTPRPPNYGSPPPAAAPRGTVAEPRQAAPAPAPSGPHPAPHATAPKTSNSGQAHEKDR